MCGLRSCWGLGETSWDCGAFVKIWLGGSVGIGNEFRVSSNLVGITFGSIACFICESRTLNWVSIADLGSGIGGGGGCDEGGESNEFHFSFLIVIKSISRPNLNQWEAAIL